MLVLRLFDISNNIMTNDGVKDGDNLNSPASFDLVKGLFSVGALYSLGDFGPTISAILRNITKNIMIMNRDKNKMIESLPVWF